MSIPPVLTGNPRTDRALANIARILGEIAANPASPPHPADDRPAAATAPQEYAVIEVGGETAGQATIFTRVGG